MEVGNDVRMWEGFWNEDIGKSGDRKE